MYTHKYIYTHTYTHTYSRSTNLKRKKSLLKWSWGRENELIEKTKECLYISSFVNFNRKTEVNSDFTRLENQNEINPPQGGKTKGFIKGLIGSLNSNVQSIPYVYICSAAKYSSQTPITMHPLSSCQLSSAFQCWLHSQAGLLLLIRHQQQLLYVPISKETSAWKVLLVTVWRKLQN